MGQRDGRNIPCSDFHGLRRCYGNQPGNIVGISLAYDSKMGEEIGGFI